MQSRLLVPQKLAGIILFSKEVNFLNDFFVEGDGTYPNPIAGRQKNWAFGG